MDEGLRMSELQARVLSFCCEDGECLIWNGGTDSGHVPQMRWDGRVQSVRRLLLQEKGQNLKGKYATVNCGNPLCVAQGHLTVLTRKQLSKRSAKVTKYHERVTRRIAISKARREKGTVLDMQKAREIRASGLTSRQAAKEFGCSQYAAWSVIAGRTWVDYSDPFSQLRRAA
jgi:hypothetical protein